MKKIIPIILIIFCLVGCKHKSFFLEDEVPESKTKDLRIVSLAPSITDMIIALGGENKIVGVTKYCTNPNNKWATIGGYMDFNKEAFLALKPNLVFLAYYHTEAKEICNAQGIKFVELDLDSFRSIRPNIMNIGQEIGKIKEATQLIDNFNKKMLKLKRSQKHPKVLIVLDRNYGTKDVGKCYIVGERGIFAEPLDLAGGINAFQGMIDTPIITAEGITKINPDVIIDVINKNAIKGDVTKDWSDFKIKAAEKGNLFVLDDPQNSIPNEKFYETIQQLADIFSNCNM